MFGLLHLYFLKGSMCFLRKSLGVDLLQDTQKNLQWCISLCY